MLVNILTGPKMNIYPEYDILPIITWYTWWDTWYSTKIIAGK